MRKHFATVLLVSASSLALACSSGSGSEENAAGSAAPPAGASQQELGAVDLAFSVGGLDVDAIIYDIVDATTNVTVRTGAAEVSSTDAQAKVSVLLPPGSFIAKLTSAGSLSCTGQTPTFVITAGNTTAAAAVLDCGTEVPVESGNAVIDASFNPANTCGLTEMFVGPLVQGATDDITLLGEALPSSSVQFVWTSSNPAAGSLNNPTSGAASLTCSSVGGSTTITLSITDAADVDCTDQQSVTVLCVGGSQCGDSVLNPGEQCDDGNTVNLDGCDSSCHDEVCGDGVLRPVTEECDDGNAIDNDACDNACHLPVCGDGVVEGAELCDGTPLCTASCVPSQCNNGMVEPGEQCDDGNNVNNDGCDNSCMIPAVAFCGDGVVQAGEQCDDGNLVSNDGCDNTCSLPVCGDGVVEGAEVCDDGNSVEADGCSNACTIPPIVCGNGSVQAGEQCDDGNVAGGDGCSATCLNEVCGNGVLDPGEQCDDGNVNNVDACSNTCVSAVCGDGIVQAPEACDDHNLVSGDGCSNSCGWENVCGISNMFVAPLTQGAGGNITLSAQADPAATVRFTWFSSNAAAGTLNNANSANATLTCSAVGGNSTVTLVVTDSINPACFDATSLPVTCRPATP